MELLQFVNAEALVLVPMLWVIGMLLKSTPRIQNWFIPWVLLLLSVIGACFILGPSFYAFAQGIIATGVAVLGHELVKETISRKKQ